MKKIWPHLILVPLLLTIPIVSSPDFDGGFSVFRFAPFQREFIRFVLAVLFFYLNLLVLLPQLFQRKEYLLFAFSIAAFFLLIAFLPYKIIPDSTEHFFPPKDMPFPRPDFHKTERIMPPDFRKDHVFRPGNFSSLHQKIFTSLMPFLFSFLSSLFIFRVEEKRNLEKAKAKADLLNLKYQLQPHFLFNTLNSIYSLTLLKSDDAPDGILKLSNVMRYVVQESGNDFVELQKELDYLKDYVALQQLRSGDKMNFLYNQKGNPGNLKIAPLILVNFVENAFKYGFNTEAHSQISVDLSIENGTVDFKIFNTIVNPRNAEQSSHIGLKNTLERLKQIYPGKHQIEISNDGKTFEVNLKINLN